MEAKGTMQDQVNNHEKRIAKLEDNQTQINENIQKINQHYEETKSGMEQIKSTVLAESNVQKDLLGTLINHHFTMKGQELTATTQVKTQEITADTEVKKVRWQTAAGLLGSGGILFAVFQWLATKI